MYGQDISAPAGDRAFDYLQAAREAVKNKKGVEVSVPDDANVIRVVASAGGTRREDLTIVVDKIAKALGHGWSTHNPFWHK